MRRGAWVGAVALLLAALAGPPAEAVTLGQDAAPNPVPGTVALLDAAEPDDFLAAFCGGSLVSPSWVLTAAHCLDGAPIDVLVGTVDLDGPSGRRIDVDLQVPHPLYPGGPLRDVALLHLAAPADGVPLVDLAVPGLESLSTPSAPTTVLGWGGLLVADPGDPQQFPSRLQLGDLPVVADGACAETLPDPASELCAGTGVPGTPAVDACFGDSGGPLVADSPRGPVQVGLVSRGPTCGESPTTYTGVAAFRDWIEGVTGLRLSTFPDLDGNVHEAAVERAALLGIATGRSDGTFLPTAAVARDQMASFLARALGLTPVAGSRFPDTAGSVHEQNINALVDAGITTGFTDGTYRPGEPVTRGQMATFLARALGLAPEAGARFPDTAGSVHEGAINAVARVGITAGYPDGTFKPLLAVERGQMASFLVRAVAPTPAIEQPVN